MSTPPHPTLDQLLPIAPSDDRDEPAVLLHSGRLDPPWSTASLTATPTATARFVLDKPHNVDAGGHWETDGDLPAPLDHDADPWAGLTQLLQPKTTGRWIGYLSYDLARWVEDLPSAAACDRDWPIIELAYCPDASLQSFPAAAPTTAAPNAPSTREDADARDAFEHAVARAIDYIGRGDVFQVNLARRITHTLGRLDASACRRLFHALAHASPAWYGAYLEFADTLHSTPQRVIASTSPELFLELADGLTITRPIKGTRPTTADAAELRDSQKDAAELNMIIDLMRNDLGRVCDFGSVRVTQPRTIESHPTVHHGVATVQGRLRTGLSTVDLLRAAFPAGSITGAPKVRAMQIIDELEPVRRGPYCGAIGWLAADACQLSVAIRTMLIEPDTGRLDYSVGGGIVADSVPAAEWQETRDKAAAIQQALRAVTGAK